MGQVTREAVLRALDRIIDPASGRSVVQEDIVQGLAIRDGNVGFAVEVDAARGGAAEPLRKACEDAVAALAGVLSVTAVLTAHQ
ncbi:MAG TPA: iron-sulfur cluster assembly protein, partial [Rhizomicrobium sp.]